MPPRAYWKGTLKLSLVSCPVVLYPATTAVEKTRFHMINKETGNRLRQQMVDSETGDVVEDGQKTPKITRDMVELAGHILHSKAAHFDPAKFKDGYEDALKALVRRKAAGKPIKTEKAEERPSNVINLMDALKQSLNGQAGKRTPQASARRRSPHRRSAKKALRSSARQRKAS